MLALSVLVAVLTTLISGCSLLPAVVAAVELLPTQAVLVSAADLPVTGVGLQTFGFPLNVRYVQGRIEADGGLLTSELARPRTVPAIAANKEIFVVGYWGGPPGFNHLHIFVSENGRTWSRAGSHLLADADQIDQDSRPSLVFSSATGKWHVAFRDALSRTIQVAKFSVGCLRDSGGGCRQVGLVNGRAITQYTSGIDGGVTNTALTTTLPPTLSFLRSNLVLGFVDQTGSINVATSSNGVDFARAVTVTSGGAAIVSHAGAPYFHENGGTLFLATAVESLNTSIDIHLWASEDGTIFRPERTINTGAGVWRGLLNPAIAGSQAEMLVAHRADGQRGTIVVRPDGSLVILASVTMEGVGFAYGPGPSENKRLSCAQPILVVTGSGSDVMIPSGGTATVDTNSDLTLRCGSSPATNAQCPGSTRTAVVERTSSSAFNVECWRRY